MRTALVVFALLFTNAGVHAQERLRLGAPFADNAVLQRGMPVPVWGWSRAGAKVTVAFAGQEKTATAGERGKWTLKLDALQASFEPREMVVRAGEEKVVIANVLVGEVWLASGQSNMQWKVQKSSCSKLRVKAKGGVAPIREFEVTSVFAMPHPIERAEGSWKNGSYKEYSAIAFAFAHKLHEELNVPVGILNCSFSQTSIQAWVPRVGFRDGEDEHTKAIYRKILETDPTTSEHRRAWGAFYGGIERTLMVNAERVKIGVGTPRAISTKTPGNMNGNRDASWLFNGRMNPVVPYAIRGAIWNQGYANMGEGLPYYHNLHSLVRGWRLRWKRPELPVYFHQFYTPGKTDTSKPGIGSTAEMRLGTALARDIPNTGMASQIDITGSIHYWNKAVPGQRLALHALKNQYGRKVVADGPMFRSYRVEGRKLIVEFDHADGGLVVAETGSNASRRNKAGTGFADPKIVEDGESRVKLFYLADENREWHPARVRIEGARVVLTSPDVAKPRGVSYATNGVGFQPNLYNRALLPMTPFIHYDQKRVTRDTWPDEELKVAGLVPDPDTRGLKHEWRKMPLLSTQFRDNAVLQAGVPITFWGSAVHDHGYEAKGDAVIEFRFAGIEKTIRAKSNAIVALGPGQCRFASGKEWRVTVPPMPASAEPKTLRVTFRIDGEVAHERVCKNIVVGDVWFVAAPQGKWKLPEAKPVSGMVRVMTRKAKRSSSPRPSRYSVCVSRTPKNRFACEWKNASGGFAGALGQRIHAKTGKPVGIVFMQNTVPKGGTNPALASWIPAQSLGRAASLKDDYEDLAAVLPGNRHYDANAMRYVTAWKRYWGEYVPEMIATRAVPDGARWGSYPTLASSVTSTAAQTYNVLVHSFTPGSVKGIVFLGSREMFEGARGAHYGEQLSVLANCWKGRFGGEDPEFVYTVPKRALAPRVTRPGKIRGKSTAVEVGDWSEARGVLDAVASARSQVREGEPLRFDSKLLAVDTNEGCDVGDVNKDGVLDVVAGRFWFAGPDYTPRPLRAIPEFGKDYSATNGDFLHDVDGDGWLDVLSIPFLETKLYWYRNPGRQGLRFGKLWPQRLLVDTKQGANEAAWLRDMDGDGKPEFMVNSWVARNPMSYWKLGKTDKGEPTATRVMIGIKGNGHGQGFGDIDGDGREDLVFGGGWYARPAKSGSLWKLRKDFTLPKASCPIVVVDLNGDGRNDMLWGSGHDYGLYYHEQLAPAGGKTRWKKHVIDESWSQAHAVAWADLTGDGRPDLITGKRVRAHSGGDPGSGEPPAMYCYTWDRAKARFTRHLIAEGVGTGLQIRARDMNGDGKLDLVTAGKDGTRVLLQK